MTTDSQRNLRAPRGDRTAARRAGAVADPIVLTAQSGESEGKALDLGAQDSLAKPGETRSLAARARVVLRRINARSGNYLSDDRRPHSARARVAESVTGVLLATRV